MKQKINVMLKKAREKAEVSQKQVKIALGYSSSQYISNFERGETLPPAEKLSKLAKVVKIPFPALKKAYLEAAMERIEEKIR